MIYQWYSWIRETWLPQAVAQMPMSGTTKSTSAAERSAPSSRSNSPPSSQGSADTEPRQASQADKQATRLLTANKGPAEGKRKRRVENIVTVSCPPIRTTPADRHIVDRKSRFTAHCARVRSIGSERRFGQAQEQQEDRGSDAQYGCLSNCATRRSGSAGGC